MPDTSAPKRLLVTGGSGFLGKAFIRAMAAEGHTVVALGRTPIACGFPVELAPTDLSDPASVRSTLSKLRDQRPFDAIVHLAVSRHHREFPAKALDLFHVNSTVAAELLEFARTTGVDTSVFGSTGTVYSSTTKSSDTSDPGDREDVFRRPSSYFAASKLFADVMAELYRGLMAVSVLRFYAPYGPGLEDRMLCDLIDRVREGRPLSLPATGPGLAFSAVYVDDAVHVLREALAKRWNLTVNVAAPEAWTIESAGHLIGKLVGKAPVFERSAAPHAPRIVPNTEKLADLLPGRVFTGLEAGLAQMIAGTPG